MTLCRCCCWLLFSHCCSRTLFFTCRFVDRSGIGCDWFSVWFPSLGGTCAASSDSLRWLETNTSRSPANERVGGKDVRVFQTDGIESREHVTLDGNQRLLTVSFSLRSTLFQPVCLDATCLSHFSGRSFDGQSLVERNGELNPQTMRRRVRRHEIRNAPVASKVSPHVADVRSCPWYRSFEFVVTEVAFFDDSSDGTYQTSIFIKFHHVGFKLPSKSTSTSSLHGGSGDLQKSTSTSKQSLDWSSSREMCCLFGVREGLGVLSPVPIER